MLTRASGTIVQALTVQKEEVEVKKNKPYNFQYYQKTFLSSTAIVWISD